MEIGNKIKALRQEKGLTQQQFAEKLYISFQSVSNWERHKGHPTTEMMLLIIERFDLPLDFFIVHPSDPCENNEEDLILLSFLANLHSNRKEKPTLKQLEKTSGIAINKIKQYYPSYDDLFYAVINRIDKDVKIRVETSLSINNNLVSVFINDMAPMLYSKKEELHLLYTRPYIRHIWIKFIKSKYLSLLIKHNPDMAADPMSMEYFIEMLMSFISVWMSQPEPEPLVDFQNRMKKMLG
ncbi:hypothetical protein GCM10025879_11900 [Leuconostoc litchii]|uniref:XRE family transcriptional regulator n=1 Tax=Leuconostoc litchii TaxID=1981069 RepID=A0A6P2CPV4_9LACO|nr:helix-turn-helix transcriptional regulator [Leuconostoc litchii]TYC46240.1 XRE family transcriptional regulator [Leuconostoc litchii]GMA69944.1 hypothetical protein GCM10025879_11900 [Leuconostoc litchii]